MDSDNKKPLERVTTSHGLDEKDIMKGLQTGGCPVCNHTEDVIFDFFAKWQYALANDEKVQREYAAEHGFCAAHTWQLAAIASPKGLSRGYPKLLAHMAEELTKLNGASLDIANGITALLKESESCRICKLLQETQETYMQCLASFLEKEEARVAYARSHGVCLRHLSLLVSFLTYREVVSFLLSEAAKKLRETAEDMERYALKHETLERHLLNHDERYAYLRALVHIAGARYVSAPHIRRI